MTMNRTARMVVSFDRNVAAPRPPKTVWLDLRKSGSEISAPFPLCKRDDQDQPEGDHEHGRQRVR